MKSAIEDAQEATHLGISKNDPVLQVGVDFLSENLKKIANFQHINADMNKLTRNLFPQH